MSAFLDGIRFEVGALRRALWAVSVLAAAALFYGLIYPAPYSPQVYRELPVYAVDQDGTALSRQLLGRMDATEEIHLVARSGNRLAAQAALQRGDVLGIVEIPSGFEREAVRGQSPVVGVFANAGYLLAYSQIAAGATRATLAAGAQLGAAAETSRGGVPGRSAAAQAPLGIQIVRLYNPGGGYASFVVPAVIVVILQQTMLIGLGLLCESRREGQPPPRAVSARTAWVFGRALPWVVLYLLQLVIILVAVFALYELPSPGAAWRVLPFMALFLLAAALFGLLIAEGFKRSDDVIPVLLFTSLPIVFLSGFSWPAQAMPVALQWLARALPSTSGVEGFVRLNQMNADLGSVLPQMLNLGVLILVFAAGLVWRSRGSAAGSSAAANARLVVGQESR